MVPGTAPIAGVRESDRLTPPEGAGTSSPTVNVTDAPGATFADVGVSDIADSPGATTRICASPVVVPKVAVSVTVPDAKPLTTTIAVLCPARMVTPAPTTVRMSGALEIIGTNVSTGGGFVRFKVRGVGYVGEFV
jgi:hypothetical protein